jgi:hypothetical protein
MGNRTKIGIDEIYEVDQMTGDMRFKGEIAFTAAMKGLLDSKAKNVTSLSGTRGSIGLTTIFTDSRRYSPSSRTSVSRSIP